MTPPADRPKTGAILVFATDSLSHSPLLWVRVQATPWYYTTRNAPVHVAYPDSTGAARLELLPVNSYDVELCDETHALEVVEATVAADSTDTLRVALKYIGLPRDGRRCEIRFLWHDLRPPEKNPLKK